MLFQIKLAYKNIWRRPVRTISIIVMMTFGIMGLLFTQGVYRGMVNQMLHDTIRTGTGHVSLYDHEYRKLKKITNAIEDPQKVVTFIENNKLVKNYITRVLQEGMVSTASNKRPVTIIGIDHEREAAFGNLPDYIIDGKYDVNLERNEIIIGSELALKLKTKVGKKIVIQTQGLDKSLSSIAYRIGAIVKTNNPRIDLAGIFLTQAQFNEFLGTSGEIHQISVMLNNELDIDTFKQEIDAILPNVIKSYTWKQINPMAAYSRDIVYQMETIIYAIIFVLVAIAIFDILVVSILERVREFGIMLAIGTTFSKIRYMIIMESAAIGILGFLSGAFFSFLMLLYLKHYGIDLSDASSGLAKMGMASVMYANIEAEYFIQAFFATLISTVVASLIPIRILRRLKPMEAIYFT
ncbi:MAG: FtsX-like permease family protein [Leptospirales bacterium]